MKTFKDFLISKHAENYHGTDDNMPDAFDEWLTEIQVDDTLLYVFVDEYVAIKKKEVAEGVEDIMDSWADKCRQGKGIEVFNDLEKFIQPLTNQLI